MGLERSGSRSALWLLQDRVRIHKQTVVRPAHPSAPLPLRYLVSQGYPVMSGRLGSLSGHCKQAVKLIVSTAFRRKSCFYGLVMIIKTEVQFRGNVFFFFSPQEKVSDKLAPIMSTLYNHNVAFSYIYISKSMERVNQGHFPSWQCATVWKWIHPKTNQCSHLVWSEDSMFTGINRNKSRIKI